MTGMQLRIPGSVDLPDTETQNGAADVYTFTATDVADGTLDRPYEGVTATAASYTLSQAIYTLPANCRLLEDTAFSSFPFGPLLRMQRNQLDRTDSARAQTGCPGVWASFMDDHSAPPNMQVELWPVPDTVYALPYAYVGDPGPMSANPAGTSTFLQIWMQPAAILAGCSSAD